MNKEKITKKQINSELVAEKAMTWEMRRPDGITVYFSKSESENAQKMNYMLDTCSAGDLARWYEKQGLHADACRCYHVLGRNQLIEIQRLMSELSRLQESIREKKLSLV